MDETKKKRSATGRPKAKGSTTRKRASRRGAGRKPAPMEIDCGTELSVVQAGELHQRLIEAAATQRPLVLKASAVEYADTAGLQLISALMGERKTADGEVPVTWDQPSQNLRNAAHSLGLDQVLGLALEAAASQ